MNTVNIQQLVDLQNLLLNENNSVDEWIKIFGSEENTKAELINEIVDDLTKRGYSGDTNDFNSMYWFARGVTSQPMRSEEFKTELKNSYEAVKGRQHELVNRTMKELNRTPTNWYIDFEQFSNEGKKLLFPELKSFFEEEIASLPIIDMYKIQFKVNNEWRTKPLKPEVWNKLMENFTLNNFIFDMDEKPPEYFYEHGGEEFPTWSLFSAIKFSRYHKHEGNNDVGGSFFRYLVNNCPKRVVDYLKRLQIFDSLTVNMKGKNVQRRELEDCCFVYAFQQTGQYDEKTLNQIRLRIQNRYLSQSSINQLCEEFKIQLRITYIDEESNTKNKKRTIVSKKNNKSKPFMGISNAAPNRTHQMNIFEKHYFLEETTPFSTYYIKHLKDEPEERYNMEFNTYHYIKARTFIKASNLVRELFKQGFFKPITFGEHYILNTVFYNEVDADIKNINLDFDKEYCTKLIAPVSYKIDNLKGFRVKNDTTYWYADFEADVSGQIHKPFMWVLQSRYGKIIEEFRGNDCAKDLLEYLPDEAVIYFHNLAYDISIRKSIIKGTKTMKADIKYSGKTLHFKDSLPILSCKLSQLPSMFNIKGIQKEIFPYKYYTLDRLKKNVGIINEAGLNEDKAWTDADYDLFKANIDKIPGCRISDTEFDMWKYASFYCQQDVTILRLGFNQFREGFIQDFHIDPFKFVSISSLANEVFNQRVYYNHNLHMIGGVVRKFCSHAVYGGRCMTAYNKKWHTTKPLSDFDAVSLYPSAMARLYTVEGIPEVIKPEQLNLDFLSKQGAYIVEIKIIKVNKHYTFPLHNVCAFMCLLYFPLIVRKTHEGLNLNDDNLAPGETVTMVVDNITLEDLIEFQKIEFEFIRGYYWSGKRDYTIQNEIRNIFNKRIEYKKQKNPLQNLYKLIMNSTYGKTIMRPVEKDYKYFREGDELNKFWNKNYFKIIDDIKIEGSDIHAVRTLKPIDKHFNFSLLGIQVLSMSKRIMNEVMCLAFDLGCHIYYQDTDSFMIERVELPLLQKQFNKKYNRELIGSNLGQFHCDFPSINNHDKTMFIIIFSKF